MQTQVTLSLDADLVRSANERAARTGKSLSQVVEEALGRAASNVAATPLPSPQGAPAKSPTPITDSLAGILRGQLADDAEYRRHLERKYL